VSFAQAALRGSPAGDFAGRDFRGAPIFLAAFRSTFS